MAKSEVEVETGTCNAGFLAQAFRVTSRNVGYWVEQGMPTLRQSKGRRGHLFRFSWALYWHAGWSACRQWGKDTPGTLETCLVGFAIDNDYHGYSFEAWLIQAKALTSEMGYSIQSFEQALQYIISNGLIRFSRFRP